MTVPLKRRHASAVIDLRQSGDPLSTLRAGTYHEARGHEGIRAMGCMSSKNEDPLERSYSISPGRKGKGHRGSLRTPAGRRLVVRPSHPNMDQEMQKLVRLRTSMDLPNVERRASTPRIGESSRRSVQRTSSFGLDDEERRPSVVTIPKTNAQRQLLVNSLSQHYLLNNAPSDAIEGCVDVMQPFHARPGSTVLVFGEPCTMLYVVDGGSFLCSSPPEARAEASQASSPTSSTFVQSGRYRRGECFGRLPT